MTGPVTFLAATACVAAGAALGVSTLRLPSRLDRAIAWGVAAGAIVVSTLLLAGAVFDRLTPWFVLTLSATQAATFALLWLARGNRFSLPSAPRLGPLVDELAADRWLTVLVLLAAGQVVWRVVIAYLMPPYAPDALWYHLTTVAGWLQERRIGPSPFTIWSTVYPFNGELLFAWPALLLHSDTLVDLVQLPFAVLAALAVAGIGRTVGLSHRGAAAAGCLFFLAPVVLSQTTANYNDVIFISFFLSGFHFVFRFLHGLSTDDPGSSYAYLLLGGAAAGLALGTKWLGIVYVGVLTLWLVGHLIVARLVRATPAAYVAVALLVFVAPLLALGAYHYVTTWIRFGGPLYPVRVSVLGTELFAGRPPECFLTQPRSDGAWWREVWGQWNRDFFFLVHPRFHAYSYDDRTSGLGPLWSYLGIPLVAVFALRLWRRNRFVLLNLLVPIAIMFALQPYRWWSRFTMIVIALGVIAIVAIVEALRGRRAAALKAAVLVCVALGVAFPILKIDGEYWAHEVLATARVPADERTVGRIALPAYRWVDRAPRGSRIGVDTAGVYFGGAPFVFAYPLFGKEFEHRVYPLPQTSEAVFARAVSKRRVSFVFVGRGRPIDRWMERAYHAGCARRIYDGLLYSGNPVRAYRVVEGCDWPRLDRPLRSGDRGRSDPRTRGIDSLCLTGRARTI